MLSVGLVGLPNVGKSTLFNALTRGSARVSNYPFTTIDGHVGVVEVPDARLERLRGLLQPSETIPSHFEVIDIAGLVEGASRGEGLGSRFLDNIRQVDAVAHVLRTFDDPDVAHVFAAPDAGRDAAVVETELLLADLEVLGRAVEKRRKVWATDPRAHAAEREWLETCLATLEAGEPLRRLDLDAEQAKQLAAQGMISAKPVLWVANVEETDPSVPSPDLEPLRRSLAATVGGEPLVVPICARLEAELAELDPADRLEMMEGLGLAQSGVDRLAEALFDRLGLIRFYTVVHGKLRAWEIPRGTLAPQAAGRVHSEMEQGFIRAEVVTAEELESAGSIHELRHSGRLRTEGKGYAVQDGDVVEFLFQS